MTKHDERLTLTEARVKFNALRQELIAKRNGDLMDLHLIPNEMLRWRLSDAIYADYEVTLGKLTAVLDALNDIVG
jgi:hypothetical protein